VTEFETPTFDPPAPNEVDELWWVKTAATRLGRRVERAAREGRLARQWALRIEQALGRVLSECDRARAAGALRPADPESPGAGVIVEGLAALKAGLPPTALPTEPARAAEEAAVMGS
jgi:hypothetical protein